VHELSLSRAIADVVTENANGRSVTTVTVRIGHFRQVVPDTLRFCWDMVVDGTSLAGCRLEIEHVPAVGHCRTCGRTWQLERPVLVCDCGDRNVELESGDEFLVQSIDVLEVI